MKLSKNLSYICLAIYALITLAARFHYEAVYQIDIATSIALGIAFVSIPGILLKKGFLTLND